jgi:selenide,water dikinase
MGGHPLTALAIAAFPKKGLDAASIGKIFQGGHDKLREAGVALLGGHTVQDEEIKFGYAVTGSIDPARILTTGGAKPGDILILTKPIGTGVVGTAIKFNRAPQQTVDEAVLSMRTLNDAAARVLASFNGVHACTDITGFGLAGHATEMALASQVTLALQSTEIPVFAGVFDLVGRNRSGGMTSNQEYFAGRVQFRPDVPDVYHDLLYDPQTSGGLLVSVDEAQAQAALQALVAAGLPAARIGTVVRGFDMKVIVR